MDLSNSLISKFVKITSGENKKETKEGTVYGTAVIYDGNFYARIDGSDLLTPIDTTANIKEGDRVTIMIKDHTATVTGNVTAPAANSDDLNEISDQITEFEIVIADKISTKELEAETARINILETNVASINTLINGNLTSNNIQSMIITGDKFTVENGFIKNAMIDSLAANKINTGTLNTNNVRIASEDGSMVMNGSTQQFKDDKGIVRIQIGKDANGEFTFCLFSQDGVGVLIDDTGIKTGAIGDGLIVNDMINEDANISGGKLDINSVISSINEEGTTTLKSSRIYLDEQEQSLQVAFNQLKTKVDTIEEVAIQGDLSNVIEQVTTNTTNIGVMQGQIKSLISNTTITKSNGTVVQLKDEFNSAVNTVNSHTQSISSMTSNINKLSGEIDSVETKTATLEQNLNGFKTTVSDTYATKTNLNTTNTNVTNAKNTADSALSKANTNASNISGLTTRVSTAESKITSSAIVNTVTSSTYWTTQTNNITKAQNTADTANSTANTAKSTANTANSTANTNKTNIATNKTNIATNASNISTVSSNVTQLSNKITWMVKSGTSQSNMTLTDKMYSLISSNITLTADHINLNGYISANGNFKIDTSGNMTANKATITGAKIIGSGTGNRILVNNGDYEIQTGTTTKAFFGLRKLEDDQEIPRLAMGSAGISMTSNNYFVMTAQPKNSNPLNTNQHYIDMAYRTHNYSTTETSGDVSNIRMFDDGDIQLSAVRKIIISTGFTNGSHDGSTSEGKIAEFGSSNHPEYDYYLDVRAIRNYQNNNGVFLITQRNDGASSNQALAQLIVYSDGFRSFRPHFSHTEGKPHHLGSGNYRWQTLYTVNALNTSSDITLKENIKYLCETPNARAIKNNDLSTQDMYDFIKNDLFLASYNWKEDPEKEDKIGFIAQDIVDTKVGEKIIVCNRDRDDTLGYDSGNFEATIAGALKVAIQKIEQLEQEINNLKGE